MDSILQIQQSDHEVRVPVRVFALTGEIDSSTSQQFQDEVQQAIDSGVRYVALDLSRLRYMSSAGVRALYALAKSLAAHGGTAPTGTIRTGAFKSPYLKLFNPSPAIRQTLDLMGFTMSIEIHNDLNQTLASF